jgi:arylsulfatase A-like enzyme
MSSRPNVLLIMTDQERYPPPYEDEAVVEYRRTRLPARARLRERGVELARHYVGSTACIPSRATLMTGQYPSLHGVTNTDGIAKTADDPAMRWLDPDSVPTMGDWFRAAGYDTHYRGKWHVSHADLLIPGSHTSLAASDATGTPLEAATEAYRRADRLEPFGFSGWVGREPHGADMADWGLTRDPIFAAQLDELFDTLETSAGERPWLTVASFVNPHDIAFAGPAWTALGTPVDPAVPHPPQAPSQDDGFEDRPRCQEAFAELWPKLLFEFPLDDDYRRLYYFLHELVDASILSVLDRLDRSGMADETIVVITSDHGDLLGAHGGLQQKWCNAFDEAVHVPFAICGPGIDGSRAPVTVPTSHVDLLPTLLGLVGADREAAFNTVAEHHVEAREPIGRDLSGLLLGASDEDLDDPVYFMTEDRITTGLRQQTMVSQEPFTPVTGAASIEMVVASLPSGADGARELWKLNHYYDVAPTDDEPDDPADLRWELHDLTNDPEERTNLAVSHNATPRSGAALAKMHDLLADQRDANRLAPRLANPVPG